MDRRPRAPSVSALLAFDGAARLQGFGRAAEELNTSQSAVSRHVRYLEERLGTALFDRAGRQVRLTRAGEVYFAAVTSALETLRGAETALRAEARVVTIACTHEVSHLLLMPRYRALRAALGRDVAIRILTSEYETVPAMVQAGADITFDYAAQARDGRSVVVLPEVIVPVAAPAFLEANAETLRRPPSEWGTLPLLALSKSNFGWASWEDWFGAQGAPEPPAPADTFDNYVYLLEAAAAGAGLALGWRGFADRYLDSRVLAPASDAWLERPSKLCARLTASGARSEVASSCLAFLSELLSKKE